MGDALRAWTLDPQRALAGARALAGTAPPRRPGATAPRAPPLWVLDEPTTALDASGVTTLQEALAAHLARGGIAVIATHQDLAVPVGVATRAATAMDDPFDAVIAERAPAGAWQASRGRWRAT